MALPTPGQDAQVCYASVTEEDWKSWVTGSSSAHTSHLAMWHCGLDRPPFLPGCSAFGSFWDRPLALGEVSLCEGSWIFCS